MMLVQGLLIVSFLLIAIKFLQSRNTSRTKAYKKVLLIFTLAFAIIVVIFPEISNTLAGLVGVGRGADLLLYALSVVVLFQLFNNYVKDREQEQKNVKIVRKIALIETQLKDD